MLSPSLLARGVGCLLLLVATARGELTMPSIFGAKMVLQRGQPNPIWGWAEAGSSVTVNMDGKSQVASVDETGRWQITLPPQAAGGPHVLRVTQGEQDKVFENVMFGEVWICSGQSNMQWSIAASRDADLELIDANDPNIRLITVPQVGTDQPQRDFAGAWQSCTPEVARDFSAVGYFFGRELYEALQVPIGLIDNSWGGSACEAWIARSRLESNPRFRTLVDHWKEREAELLQADDENSRNVLRGNQRPANIYNGVLHPTIGYGIRGVIWYQGETNAGRAYQYRDLFPLMIRSWREEWGQGDFPFYWVQLADFKQEVAKPRESDWAELREAQSMAMELPHTGQAVIIDLGEANDIHPRNKLDVAKRLARWALAKNYGFEELSHRSPTYRSLRRAGDRIVLTFDHVDGGLSTHDVNELLGFAISGEDRQFHKAQARFVGDRSENREIEVWSDQVADPVAVRYGWADNPVCNLRSRTGLPLTPFRTDQWDGITKGKEW